MLTKDLCAALDAAKEYDSTIAWNSGAANAFYLGTVAQAMAAGFIALFLLFNALTCLCQCLSPCCKSQIFNVLLALMKLALAFMGVVSMGTQMTEGSHHRHRNALLC